MAYKKLIAMVLYRDWLRIKARGSKTGWFEQDGYSATYYLAPWTKAGHYISDVAGHCVTHSQCRVHRPAKLGWTRYRSPHMQALPIAPTYQ